MKVEGDGNGKAEKRFVLCAVPTLFIWVCHWARRLLLLGSRIGSGVIRHKRQVYASFCAKPCEKDAAPVGKSDGARLWNPKRTRAQGLSMHAPKNQHFRRSELSKHTIQELQCKKMQEFGFKSRYKVIRRRRVFIGRGNGWGGH